MPDIKFATADVSAMKLGTTNVSKVMLGTVEVWPGVVPGVFPVIATTNTKFGTSMGVSNPANMPAGIVAGDLLLAFCCLDSPVATITASAGWTTVYNVLHGEETSTACFARVADGGADTLALSGTTLDFCTAVLRITGHDVTALPSDIKYGTALADSSPAIPPDPPSLDTGTPRDWLWLAVIGIDTDVATLISTTPAGYAEVLKVKSAASTSSCEMGIAKRERTAQTEDPGQYIATATIGVAATLAVASPATPPAAYPHAANYSTKFGPTGSASNPITAPAGVTVGDLLLAFVSNDNPAAVETTASTGWTRLIHATQGANVHRAAMFARVADGGANDALSITTATPDYCCSLHRITGHSVANVSTDLYFASASSGSDGNADPPAINAGTSHPFLWLAVAIIDAVPSTVTAMPSGYTQVANITSAGTTSSSVLAVARKTETTATQDPGTFTNSTRPWIAMTVGVPGP